MPGFQQVLRTCRCLYRQRTNRLPRKPFPEESRRDPSLWIGPELQQVREVFTQHSASLRHRAPHSTSSPSTPCLGFHLPSLVCTLSGQAILPPPIAHDCPAPRQVLGQPLFLQATMLLGTIPFPCSGTAPVLPGLSPTEVTCCPHGEGRWVRIRGGE